MDKNRTDFSTMVSVQPFWDAEKSHKSLFWPKEITAHPLRLCMS